MIALLFFKLMFISNMGVTQNSLPDNISPNDHLFVWARNGLNVRSGPGTSFEIIDGLNYGDSVQIISKTDVSFNLALVSKVDSFHSSNNLLHNIGNVIHYGQWVRVKLEEGAYGYVISQFLLNIRPDLLSADEFVPLEIKSIDTIYSGNTPNNEGLYHFMEIQYYGSVKRTDMGGSSWSETTIEFKGFTIAEVIMITQANDEDNLIQQNWKNEVKLIGLEGMCHTTITKKGGSVIYYFMCAC